MEFIYTTAIDKLRALTKRKRVIQGGTSASKTFGILAILIDRAARTPHLEISVVGATLPFLKKGAMKDFKKIMNATNRWIASHWNITESKYTFANGAYIEFFSVDTEEKQRGARRDVLYINESNNINFETYHQLAVRTNQEIWLDFNPTNRFWAHDEVLQEPDSELLILNYEDNEAIPQTAKDELLLALEKAKTNPYWENWCNVYVYGQVGKLEGVVFSNWREVHEIPEEAKLLGYGLDFGYTNDPTALTSVYMLNNELYLDELIYQKGLTNSDLANMMKQLEVKGEIYADSAEPKSINELRRYGLQVRPASKGRDSIMYGINVMQNYDISITKRSTNLIEEFTKYSWMKDKAGSKINTPIDVYNHGIDSVRYLCMSKLGQNKGSGSSVQVLSLKY